MTVRKTPRLAAAATLATATALIVVVASAAPALAIGERGDPGGGMSAVQTLLVFVGIPLAAFVVIMFLVYLPSMIRGPRYRPGRAWTLGTVWVDSADAARVPGVDAAAAEPAGPSEVGAATLEGGGSSARW